MHIPLACADFTFPLLGHEQSLDLIALLKFDGVDLGLFEGRSHLWPSREFKAVARSARKLRKKLDDRGLRAADVFLQADPDFQPYAINHPAAIRRRKVRDWFAKTLEYASICGAKHVSALPGVFFREEPKPKSWGRACDELAWRIERAKEHGIIFGVEAHVGSIAPNPPDALRLVQSVPGLTLTLDYTHFTRRGIPDAAVEPLLKYATHFHTRGARKGRLQTSFKHNTIDYRRILEMMQATGYRGYMGVEYVWIDWEHCNEVDNLSETILFRDFIRSFLSRRGDA
jgi:sugar phosphate isomerase/epimerase